MSYPDLDFENRVDKIKSDLLSYYSSQQISQGARLVGFAVGTFTLLQVVLHQNHISEIFPDARLILTSNEFLVSDGFWKVFILALGTFMLLVWLIRAIFRFAVFSCLANWTKLVYHKKVQEYISSSKDELSIHAAVMGCARIKYSEEKNHKHLYWLLPSAWFFPFFPEEKTETWKGGIVVTMLAFVSTLTLFWLLL
jgi:hypothetical protein